MSKRNEKSIEYAAIITGAIADIFQEESDYSLDQQELFEGDNLTHFMNALANTVPTFFYNKLTGQNKNQVEVNHIATRLCYQYNIGRDEEYNALVEALKGIRNSVNVHPDCKEGSEFADMVARCDAVLDDLD